MTSDPTTPSGPSPAPRLYRLGVWTATHPWRVGALWLVLLVAATVSAGYFTTHLTGSTNVVTGSDSRRAARLIEEEFPDTPAETDFLVLHSTTLTAQDKAFRDIVGAAMVRFPEDPAVTGIASPYDTPARLISTDASTALIPLTLDGNDTELQDAAGPLQDIAEELATGDVEV
jgi:putative drug exporter of the RND superfamily